MHRFTKKATSLLMTLVLIVSLVPAARAATVASGTCGDNLNWTYTDDGTLTITGTGAMESYPIQSYSPWYSFRDSITQLVLPSGLTSIGNYAFYGCSNLTLSELPASVTSIGALSFTKCTSLALTELPSGVTSIGNEAFSGCTGIALTELPEGITSIGSVVFSGCTNLALTELPAGVTSIGTRAFAGCTNLALTELPVGVTSIMDSAFDGCTNIALAKLPDGITSIKYRAFADCSSLALTELPAGVTSIEVNAFYECTNLALTELPAGITSIGSYAFSYCDNLALTELPTGITSIEEGTFKDCPNLALTGLPAGVTSIGKMAFFNCHSLALTELPETVTSISDWAFGYCDSLVLTTLPAGLTTIRDNTFYGCTSLALTELPAGITSIAQGAFNNCTSLALAELPAGVKSIGANAFSRCTSLTLTELPAGVTSIGQYAFDGCTSLALTKLPNGITLIENGTFGLCYNLALTELPSGVTSIGNRAFYDCRKLTLADLPAGITFIGIEAFINCTNQTFLNMRGSQIINAPWSAPLKAADVVWHAKKVTLEDGYSEPSTVWVDGTKGFVPATATQIQGYNIAAWTYDNDGTTLYESYSPIPTDCNLYAVWEPSSGTAYTVAHYQQDINGDGYTLEEVDNLTGMTDATVMATAKSYVGFHELTTHADRVPSGSVASDGSLMLKLYYDRDLFSVTFDSEGGTNIDKQEGIRFEATASVPAAPSKPGYNFGGWWADESYTIAYDVTAPVTTDVTVYASWAPKGDTAYKVEHYQQNIAGAGYTLKDIDNLTSTTGTMVTAIAKGYPGFHEIADHASRVPSGSVVPDGSLVLKLYYDRDLCTVTFNSKGGTNIDKQEGIRFESAAIEPTQPTKIGYDFGGWWADESCTIAYNFAAPVTADKTVYASWMSRSDTAYKVEHYQQNIAGSGYTLKETDSLTGNTDATATALAKPYTGFHNVEVYGAVSSGSIVPDGSLVLKLYYDRDLCTVTFDSMGGTSIDKQEGIRFETTAIEPAQPTKIGYDFGGWWADEDCTIDFDFSAPITMGVVVHVSWLPRTYTLTLDPNGGEVDTPSIQAVYGNPYGNLPIPTKNNSTFVGWYTQADGGTKVIASDIMDKAQNSILYAQWSNDEYGIVDGNVQDQNNTAVANAKIIIRAGAVNYKTTVTDSQGRFTITNVKYGTYNLVVEKGERIVTTLFKIQSAQETQSAVLPNGITNSVIVVKENTPEIVVGGLDDLYSNEAVYTPHDAAIVDGGGKVELRLTIAEKKTGDAGADDQEISRIATKPLNMLLEMNITKEVYEAGANTPETVMPLTELPELMTIIIPLSDEQRGKTGYTVFRSHGGSVDIIGEEPNLAGEYIEVQADQIILFASKFSVYALAFDVQTSDSSYSVTVTATAGPGGKISPKGKVSVPYGATKTFTITPDIGHQIADVLVDGKSVGSVISYKFSGVSTKHTIEAVFRCPSSEFSDLDTNKWYHLDVDYVIAAGYMQGIGHGLWAPDQSMTRAEFSAVLARLQGATLTSAASSYEDVSAAAWYAPAVAWMQEVNFGRGYSQRNFGPDDALTREQLALMLFRCGGSSDPGSANNLTAYEDGGSISLWAKDAVVWAVNAGLLQGDDKGRLNPGGDITRAEVAAILKRFVEDQ